MGKKMHMRKHGFFRVLAMVLAVTLVVTMCPFPKGINAYAETNSLVTEQPEIVVTGSDVIGSSAYSADNVGLEKAYTRAELKALNGGENVVYSALNSYGTKKVYKATGVYIESLLAGTAFDASKDVLKLIDNSKKYTAIFDPAGEPTVEAKTSGFGETRYNFPGLASDSEEGKKEVKTMLAWATADGSSEPSTAGSEKSYCTVVTGQLSVADVNNPMYNKYMQTVQAGDALSEKVLTVGTSSYTRADVLLMARAERTYSYSSSSGDRTDTVVGVPMSVLLKGYGDNDIVTFGAADEYPVKATGKTDKELIDSNYMLAYEKGGKGIYETAKDDSSIYGFLTLYGDGDKPAKLVNSISVTASSGIDFSKSPFKHITNGGLEGDSPYNIDAITGATLTVEGPGVEESIPLPVRDLENRNAGAFRGDYTDTRNGVETERTYEGIDLYYVLNNMSEGSNGIRLTDTAEIVELKNRNRDTVAVFTMGQVIAAHDAGKPILIAYGTGYTDGSKITPFVFDGGTGADKQLGNEDGCLKLVYDKSVISGDLNGDYKTFASMAYIYVAEESTPGFKHTAEPYNTAENTQYVLTITGKEIGREVNYKVEDLEAMVEYDESGVPVADGFGYRDEYKLANNTYWYVNEYEGIKLWDLLQTAGLSAAKANDDKTQVTFTARDGYTGFDTFTLKQIADPDCFGYYEKNPADNNDGKYTGVPDDLLDTGYPVLVAYGVNKYPYVIEKDTPGFLSGLSNDGGPLRVISGKLNYAHANGSSQAQKLDKVIVGEDTYHYSTHKYHEKNVYKKLADEKLTINVVNGTKTIKSAEYSVGDIEDILYGEDATTASIKDAKIKGYYEAEKKGDLVTDLYEGVNLSYFLKNIVEIPGEKGTITFNMGAEDEYSMDLESLLKLTDGYNTNTKLSGLEPVLAFAKNGAPMVNSKEEADGYESDFTVGEGKYASTYDVKNNGGPLSVMIPNTSKDVKDAKAVTNVSSITIHLSADKYAHIEAPYDTYASETLTISGEGTRLTEPKIVTVGELEAKQTIAETGVYSVLKNGASEATQTRFRGLNVYKLLQQYGLKSNADKVIFTDSEGNTYEFTLSEVSKKYKNTVSGADNLSMILAYGSAPADNTDAEEGLPLVADKNSEGYDSAYGNNGGPLKLVVGQVDAADANSGKNIKDVVAIEVTASEQVSWDHNSAEVYKQYLDYAIDFVVYNETDTVNPIYTKKITVAEIEAMTSLVEREEIYTSAWEEWEGVHLWNMIQEQMKDVPGQFKVVGISPKQGSYGPELIGKFGEAALKDGIEGKPIIVAYAVNGKPLVPGSTKTGTQNGEGFDTNAQNNGGPLRTITQNSTGTCIQELERIEVVVRPEGAVGQTDKFDTSVAGKDLPFAGVRSVSFDAEGGMWVGTYGGGAAYKAAGADSYAVISANSTPALATSFVSAVAADAEGGVWLSQNASYTNPTENKGVVYMDKDGKLTSYTVEENPGTIPDNYVQDIKIDAKGNVWFASFGGLTKYDPASGEWKTWTKADSGFPAEAVTKIEFDGNGGVWLGFYPEGTTDGNGGIPFTGGFAHMTADGKVTSYPLTATSTAEGTSKLAEVWIRDLAVAKDGSVWVVASGAYANIENVGGSVWHVASPGAEAKTYTGDSLFGKALDGAENAELRMVAADNNGGLWFGTSADGVFYISDPTVAEDGTMTITTMYNTETGSWTETGMDNVYSLDFYNGTVYAGSAAGLAWLKAEALKENIGDADADKAELKITGTGVENNAYFSMKGLKNAEGVVKVKGVAYDHKNSSGTLGRTTFDGLTMKSLFDLVGLKEGANKVTIVADNGGYKKEFTVEQLTKTDKDGNVPILALTEYKDDGTEEKCTKLVIGQDDPEHINKSSWVSNICEIIIDAGGSSTPDTPVTPNPPADGDTVGDATAETAEISFVGNGFVKEGYFSIKGLKNAEGLEKGEFKFSWMNKAGTTGTSTVEGAEMRKILKDLHGITDDANTIVLTSSDGFQKVLPLDDMFTKDKDDNRPVLAWKVDGSKEDTPMLIIGQADANDVNKSKWIKSIVKVQVLETEVAGELEPIIHQDKLGPDYLDNKEELKAAGFDTIEKIEKTLHEKMETLVDYVVSEDNTTILEIELVYEGTGEPVAKEDFPEEGLDIYIDYAKIFGDKNVDYNKYSYKVVHMFSMDMNGHKAGELEELDAKVTDKGLKVHVEGLSPFAISYESIEGGSTPGTPDDPNKQETPDKPSDKSDAAKTGDDTNMFAYGAAMILALAGAAVVLGRRREN